jgi:regulator of replication initiation timing
MEEHLKVALSENADMTKQLQDLQRENLILNEDLQAHQINARDSADCVESLRNLVVDMKTAMDSQARISDELAEQLKDTDGKHSSVSVQLSDVKSKYSSVVEEQRQLSDTLTTNRSVELSLRQQLQELSDELSATKAQRDTYLNTGSDLKVDSEKVRRSLEEVTSHTETLSYELHKANSSLCDANLSAQLLQEKYEQLQNTHDELQLNYDHLRQTELISASSVWRDNSDSDAETSHTDNHSDLPPRVPTPSGGPRSRAESSDLLQTIEQLKLEKDLLQQRLECALLANDELRSELAEMEVGKCVPVVGSLYKEDVNVRDEVVEQLKLERDLLQQRLDSSLLANDELRSELAEVKVGKCVPVVDSLYKEDADVRDEAVEQLKLERDLFQQRLDSSLLANDELRSELAEMEVGKCVPVVDSLYKEDVNLGEHSVELCECSGRLEGLHEIDESAVGEGNNRPIFEKYQAHHQDPLLEALFVDGKTPLEEEPGPAYYSDEDSAVSRHSSDDEDSMIYSEGEGVGGHDERGYGKDIGAFSHEKTDFHVSSDTDDSDIVRNVLRE